MSAITDRPTPGPYVLVTDREGRAEYIADPAGRCVGAFAGAPLPEDAALLAASWVLLDAAHGALVVLTRPAASPAQRQRAEQRLRRAIRAAGGSDG